MRYILILLSVVYISVGQTEILPIKGFTYLGEHIYTCGGQSNTIREYRQDLTDMVFVLVPGGSFKTKEKRIEVPSFLMSKYEVTQGVWKKIMGTEPWQEKAYTRSGDNYAAVYISWYQAKEFCKKTGLALPSQTQWEYACRAGTTSTYYWGNKIDKSYCWHRNNSWDQGKQYAQLVGQKKPNAFGLYDMSGNVWEWCEDTSKTSQRMSRGGSVYFGASFCASGYRSWIDPKGRSDDLGFRVWRPIPSDKITSPLQIKGFSYLRTQTYSCGVQIYSVREYRHKQTGMEMVLVPSGEFMMGDKSHRWPKKLWNKVTITAFLMSKYEVTQKIWKSVMKTTPWKDWHLKIEEGDNYPAVYISWKEAQEFCNKTGFKLPSEAQWEYACRAGTKTSYYWGQKIDKDYCWYQGNRERKKYIRKVGQKNPNAFGLYDMVGNIEEWCLDLWHEDYRGAPRDGSPWVVGNSNYRVCRSSSSNAYEHACRSSFRQAHAPATRNERLGFRVWHPIAIAPQIAPPQIKGFTYLRTSTYSCGGRIKTVREYQHHKTGIEMTLIPEGTFVMGSLDFSCEKPRHEVRVPSFLIARHEITQRMWTKIMGSAPWRNKKSIHKGKEYPAVNISWNKAQEFCRKTGLQLPSEAQWEYASRAGTISRYYWGEKIDGTYLWYQGNKKENSYAQKVRQKKSNAFGLYDMAGNVWEWCEDTWHNGYQNAPTDGRPWVDSGSPRRVFRGGCFADSKQFSHSAFRNRADPLWGSNKLGFRVAYKVKVDFSIPQINGFTFLEQNTYSVKGQKKTVREYRHNNSKAVFVLIPGGTLKQGKYYIKLDPFLISKYEVTQGLWKKFMKTSPWQGKHNVKQGDNRPAMYISWNEAKKFCQKTKLALPSETQWLYAFRGEASTSYYWGEEIEQDYLWYQKNTEEKVCQQVGQKKPNLFGLYDLAGNVEEWCEDMWHPGHLNFYYGSPLDGKAWIEPLNLHRVSLGGSFFTSAQNFSMIGRKGKNPKTKECSLGFRLCMPVPPNIPKDVHERAKRITAGSYPSLKLISGERDWYQIHIKEKCSLHIEILFIQKQGDLDLIAYKDSKVIAKSVGTNDGESFYLKNLSPGAYFFEVRGYRKATNNYSLSLTLEKEKIPGFTYLKKATYSCGGKSHTVDEYRHNRTGMIFIFVPGGSFTMGSSSAKISRFKEYPAHTVKIQPFLMSKYEVTQKVWKKVMGKNNIPWKDKQLWQNSNSLFFPPAQINGPFGHKKGEVLYFREGDSYPAVYISWPDAKEFCRKTGLQLPSEAQWEYACRAGTDTDYYWGDKMYQVYCWYKKNTKDAQENYAHKVGGKRPNAFGLYDMIGNVWEWCEDMGHTNYQKAPNDGSPWISTSSSSRIYRGAAFDSFAQDCHCAKRSGDKPWFRSPNIGFRCVQKISDKN